MDSVSQSIYPPLLTENTFGRYRILHEPARARTQLIPGAVHFTTTASLPFWPGDYLWQSFYIRIPDLSLSLSAYPTGRAATARRSDYVNSFTPRDS